MKSTGYGGGTNKLASFPDACIIVSYGDERRWLTDADDDAGLDGRWIQWSTPSGQSRPHNQMEKQMEQEKKIPFLRKVTEFDKEGKPGEVKFILGNGQDVTVIVAEVSEKNKYHAMIHGIQQRLGDATATLSKTNNFGKAFEELSSLRDQLKLENWNREREGGISKQNLEDLIAALAKLKKQDVEVVRVAVEKADDDTRKKWAKNTKVDAEIQDIRKRRADAAKKASKDSIDDIDLGIEEEEESEKSE